MLNILLIDDEVDTLKPMMEIWTEWAGLQINWKFASTPTKGLNLLSQGGIGLILMDGNLISITGDEVVLKIRKSGDQTRICMFSSEGEQNERGCSVGADFSINKKEFSEEYIQRRANTETPTMEYLATIITIATLGS